MDDSTTALVKALAVTRRRYVLSVLSDHRRGLSEGDLATMVASMETGDAVRDVSEDAHRRVRTDLRHRHLPELEATGLIRRDEEAGTVSAADYPLTECEPVTELLDAPTEVTETQERVLENAVRPRRRAVLSILEASGSLSLRELGERVAAREEDAAVSDLAEGRIEETLISLHHTDLPKLEDADLLAYDHETRTVTYRCEGAFDDGWLDESAFEAARDELSESPAGDVCTLDERARRYGNRS